MMLAVCTQPLLCKGSKAGLHFHLTEEESGAKKGPLMEGPKTDPDDKDAKSALNTTSDTPVQHPPNAPTSLWSWLESASLIL